jgi:anthranilate 1,2-dioxygenase small subunit
MADAAPTDVRTAIADLIAEAARLIDEDQIEDWVNLFTTPCRYRVTTRENYDRGLPISLIDCDSLGMLQDRVLSYREANVYNPHRDRHVLGPSRLLGQHTGGHEVYTAYAVYQTNPAGESTLFSVGKYLDRIVFVDGAARFAERTVVADTAAIQNLLATPL